MRAFTADLAPQSSSLRSALSLISSQTFLSNQLREGVPQGYD